MSVPWDIDHSAPQEGLAVDLLLTTVPIGYMAKPGGDVERNDATVFNTILWFEIDLWQIPSGVRFALDSRRGGQHVARPWDQ